MYTLQQDFLFTTPGIYKIPITYSTPIIQNCNQTEQTELTVLVKPGPLADFSFTNQCFRDTVFFNSLPTTGNFNIVNHLWTFHDLTTQNTANAKKLYPAPGNYSVNYKIISDNGCVNDTVKTIVVSAGNTPTLTVSLSGNYCVDSSISFSSSIAPISGNPAIWYWDFGDGQTASSTSSPTTTHSYLMASGNRIVKHLVTLTTGCNPDTVTTIIPAVYNNPVATFSIAVDTPCPRKPVLFNSTVTGIANWKWNFGNGTGNQVPPFTITYPSENTFPISLIVTDNNGCGSMPATSSVTINPDPIISAGLDKIISLGTSTTLDATIATPNNYNFLWSPNLFLNSTFVINPVSNPDRQIIYTILATNRTTLCSATDNVTITPISKLYIPTSFTPNNDGKNDTWNIPGLALYPEAAVSVYNRWGQRIFYSKNYLSNPWNGRYKGILHTHATYVYMIELNDIKKEVLKGLITLIY